MKALILLVWVWTQIPHAPVLQQHADFVLAPKNVFVAASYSHINHLLPGHELCEILASERSVGCRQNNVMESGSKVAVGNVGVFAKGELVLRRPKNDTASCAKFVTRGLPTIRDLGVGRKLLSDHCLMQMSLGTYDIGPQRPPRSLARLPKSPHQQANTNRADISGYLRPLRRFTSGVSGLPLGAKIALSLLATCFAASILFNGFLRLSNGGSDRLSGLAYFLAGCGLLWLGWLLWSA